MSIKRAGRQTRKLLVIGCGRSGTNFTVKALQAVGLDVRHEEIGNDGGVSMYHCVENPVFRDDYKEQWRRTGQLQDFNFEKILHQVRHPLNCIDSIGKSFTHKVRIWTNDNLGVPLPGRSGERQCPPLDKLHWAMLYWLRCNNVCTELADDRFQIEEIEPRWVELFGDLTSQRYPSYRKNIRPTLNRSLRHAFRSKSEIKVLNEEIYDTTWDVLGEIDKGARDDVYALGEAYGYGEIPPRAPGESH